MSLGEGSRILVTGGAGFLGSTLVDALLARGCRIIVIDDLSNGVADNLCLRDSDGRLALRVAKVGDDAAADLVDAEVARADAVFHLASPIGVLRAHSERLDVTRTIIASGMAVVDACRRHRKPLLYTSSSEVYGPGQTAPIGEDSPVLFDLRPRWGYASSKATVEHLVAGLFHDEGVPAWIVRPFNMSGARQRPTTGQVLPLFADAALRGEPLVLHDDGQQQRAFLHVQDAVAGLIAIASCPALRGLPVNLGGDEPVRIADLALMVQRAVGFPIGMVNRPSSLVFGEGFAVTRDRIPDTRRLRGATGWRPRHTVQETVDDCVMHLRMLRAEAA